MWHAYVMDERTGDVYALMTRSGARDFDAERKKNNPYYFAEWRKLMSGPPR